MSFVSPCPLRKGGGRIFMRRANRNLPPATLLTGGRLGKASDRLGLTIETDPMPAYKRFGG